MILDPPISAGRRSLPPDAQTQVIARPSLPMGPRSSRNPSPSSRGPRSARPQRSSAPAAERVSAPPLDPAAAEDERARLIAALDACAGNQTRAAQLLGITRRQLISRIEYWQLPRPKKR